MFLLALENLMEIHSFANINVKFLFELNYL